MIENYRDCIDGESLQKLRRDLHQYAEPSGHEQKTSCIIWDYLDQYAPDEMIANLGGFGIAAIYWGKKPGPTVVVRCELDALPIAEAMAITYGSVTPGVSHKCGHDGHMAIVSGLAPILHKHRPEKGKVVLLYQPEEETGQGAEKVIKDARFSALQPEYMFAMHNLPGFPKGQVVLRKSVFASASTGLIVSFKGESSHAAEPQNGRSPALAVAQIIQGFSAAPQFYTALGKAAQVTIIHVRLGEIAFGTSPGEATVMATLRAHEQDVMEQLGQKCLALVRGTAQTFGLDYTTEWVEDFPATVNDGKAVDLLAKAADKLNLECHWLNTPFSWSEDFGHFTTSYRGALFGLGAGLQQPALHNSQYDFPDDLIATGVCVFWKVIEEILGTGVTKPESGVENQSYVSNPD